MPSDLRVRDALLDMQDNILLAQQFVQGLSFEEFSGSRLHFYAATRALEIVSEASRRLTDEIRARHSHLPWRAIRDVGNFYRHQYDNIVEAFVWKTIQTDLLPLLAAIREEVARIETEQR